MPTLGLCSGVFGYVTALLLEEQEISQGTFTGTEWWGTYWELLWKKVVILLFVVRVNENSFWRFYKEPTVSRKTRCSPWNKIFLSLGKRENYQLSFPRYCPAKSALTSVMKLIAQSSPTIVLSGTAQVLQWEP